MSVNQENYKIGAAVALPPAGEKAIICDTDASFKSIDSTGTKAALGGGGASCNFDWFENFKTTAAARTEMTGITPDTITSFYEPFFSLRQWQYVGTPVLPSNTINAGGSYLWNLTAPVAVQMNYTDTSNSTPVGAAQFVAGPGKKFVMAVRFRLPVAPMAASSFALFGAIGANDQAVLGFRASIDTTHYICSVTRGGVITSGVSTLVADTNFHTAWYASDGTATGGKFWFDTETPIAIASTPNGLISAQFAITAINTNAGGEIDDLAFLAQK